MPSWPNTGTCHGAPGQPRCTLPPCCVIRVEDGAFREFCMSHGLYAALRLLGERERAELMDPVKGVAPEAAVADAPVEPFMHSSWLPCAPRGKGEDE